MNALTETLRADPVSILLPDCKDPAERDIRNRLLLARDLGHANLGLTAGHVQRLSLMIVEVAGATVFAPLIDLGGADQLQLALNHCRALMRCGASAEMLGFAE